MDILKLLKNKRVAVIGGAKSKTDIGEIVDSYDIVIRINLVLPTEIEQGRGKKITIQVVSNFEMFNYYDVKPKCDIIACFIPRKDNVIVKNEYCFHPRYWKEAQRIIDAKKPTTGFLILYYLFANDIKADIFNFDFYETPSYHNGWVDVFLTKNGQSSSTEHLAYHSTCHNPKAEKEYWNNNPFHNFK